MTLLGRNSIIVVTIILLIYTFFIFAMLFVFRLPLECIAQEKENKKFEESLDL